MDGTELAARLSYKPNALGYCGPADACNSFMRLLQSEGGCEEVRKALGKFEGLYPYLQTIAEAHGKEPLDEEVVEAYWIGNSLLDSLTREHAEKIIEGLTRRGLVRSLAEELKKGLPEKPVLSHAFHVLYVGPGNTTHTVEPTLPVKDSCRVSAGEITDVIDEHNLVVLRKPLLLRKGSYSLGGPEPFKALYDRSVLKAKVGDVVALHWGYASLVLSGEQQANLEKYTSKALEFVNNYLRDST